MTQLLRFMVTFLSALFDQHGFCIKESNNSGNRFRGASILIGSSDVDIFLAIERDEITAYFRSLGDERKDNWYSVEIVLALLGHQDCRGVLDERNSPLLRDGLSEIVRCFRGAEAAATLERLDDIERKRSRQM